MKTFLLFFLAANALVGCTPSAKEPNDPHVVPVGKATGAPVPAQASCETNRGAPVDADIAEGARIVDVCISGAKPEHTVDVKKTMRLGPDKKLTADMLRSDLRALYDSGLFDQVEATARAAGSGAILLYLKLEERRTITGVSIEGMKSLKEAGLVDELPKKGSVLNLSAIRTATQKVRDVYALEGWEEAKIDHVVIPDDKGGARLKIVVTEGIRAKLGKVTFEGAKGGREVALRKAIEMEDGAPVSAQRLSEAALKVNAFYYDAGFLQVHVADPKRTRAADGTTAVAFPITEGAIFKLRSIKVKNVDPNTEKDILASMKVKPGDIFSRAKLVSDIASVKASMSLKGRVVTVEPETELKPKTNTVELVLTIRDGA